MPELNNLSELNEFDSALDCENASDNPQICICYDVYLDEICAQVKQGVNDIDELSDLTYACQGCGGCRPKLAMILDMSQKSNESTDEY